VFYIGPPESEKCSQNLGLLKKVCGELGVPLALAGPSIVIEFLGISISKNFAYQLTS